MYSSELTVSLGNLAHALSTLDKGPYQEDIETLKALVSRDSNGELAPLAYLLNKGSLQPETKASDRGMYQEENQQAEVNEKNRKRLIKILFRMAGAKEGISRQEQAFLVALWRNLPELTTRHKTN